MFYGKPKKDTYGTSELYSQVLGDMQHIEKQQKSVHNIYTTMNSVKLLKNSVKKTHVPNLASRGCKVIHMKPNKSFPWYNRCFRQAPFPVTGVIGPKVFWKGLPEGRRQNFKT